MIVLLIVKSKEQNSAYTQPHKPTGGGIAKRSAADLFLSEYNIHRGDAESAENNSASSLFTQIAQMKYLRFKSVSSVKSVVE